MIRERKGLEATGFEKALNIREVRDVLGVSFGHLFELIRNGDLPAFRVNGKPIKRSEINERVMGLRVTPSDLRAYLDTIKVK